MQLANIFFYSYSMNSNSSEITFFDVEMIENVIYFEKQRFNYAIMNLEELTISFYDYQSGNDEKKYEVSFDLQIR